MSAQTILPLTATHQFASVVDTDRARVLIADDQPDVRYALSLLLRSAGYDVRTADGPAAVLAAIAKRTPTLSSWT
jgi:Response regulator containing CheY-like receiver, AAA-type ATPase, and DNA-binding domains